MNQKKVICSMENLKKYQLNRKILCIDLRSFYASVECALRGLNPFTTPLVVADKGRGGGSIVLAVTPYLKERGIPSRCRIFELPENLNIIYARPQMAKYLEYSSKVIEVYLEFISDSDLYIYSIDESFLDVTHYLDYYKVDEVVLAYRILKRIEEKLCLYATCGIGPNMLLSKLALDLEAKKKEDGIAKWAYEDVKDKLWKVTPLSKMWGIGSRMEARLQKMGFYEIGDIARSDVGRLKRSFGILGEELWYHTNGIDLSLVQDKIHLRTKSKSYGSGQVLFRDYTIEEIPTIILEMIDEVVSRLRLTKKRARTIALSIGYSKEYGGGFSRQLTLFQPTANESVIFDACLNLLDTYYEPYPIRRVSVYVSNLVDHTIYQYSIFEDIEKIDREYKIGYALDSIKRKYGKNAVNRLSSEQEHATAKKRNNQIGGHHV